MWHTTGRPSRLLDSWPPVLTVNPNRSKRGETNDGSTTRGARPLYTVGDGFEVGETVQVGVEFLTGALTDGCAVPKLWRRGRFREGDSRGRGWGDGRKGTRWEDLDLYIRSRNSGQVFMETSFPEFRQKLDSLVIPFFRDGVDMCES